MRTTAADGGRNPNAPQPCAYPTQNKQRPFVSLKTTKAMPALSPRSSSNIATPATKRAWAGRARGARRYRVTRLRDPTRDLRRRRPKCYKRKVPPVPYGVLVYRSQYVRVLTPYRGYSLQWLCQCLGVCHSAAVCPPSPPGEKATRNTPTPGGRARVARPPHRANQ